MKESEDMEEGMQEVLSSSEECSAGRPQSTGHVRQQGVGAPWALLVITIDCC